MVHRFEGAEGALVELDGGGRRITDSEPQVRSMPGIWLTLASQSDSVRTEFNQSK